MGRPGLSHHPKFLMLARALGEVAARGVLELMWEVSYESGDDRLGSPDAVEAAARWRGERGACFAALRDSTGQGRVGFIEERDGVWCVHDLWDHAPDYVRKRATREEQRRVKGRSLAAERRAVTGQDPVSDRALTPPRAPSTQHPAPSTVELPFAGEPPPAAGKVEVENAAARELREAWNELTPPVLARWRESAGRNKVAAEALKRRPLEQWREVFARIGRCPRLHVGIGEAGWRANPDWAIRKPGVKAEPAQQVLEGAWDGPVSAQTGQRRPTGADPNQGILTRERVETAEEIEEANRRAEEWANGG